MADDIVGKFFKENEILVGLGRISKVISRDKFYVYD
jgi:hypothetical protein